MKPKIGISIGDINGIGPEIIIKTFLDKKLFEICTPIVYGHTSIISYYLDILNIQNIDFQVIENPEYAVEGQVNIIHCWDNEAQIDIGQATNIAGEYALKAITLCTQDTLAQKIDAMITAPIHKKNISNQIPFSGHTEYITQQVNVKESLMFMISKQLRIGLVCNHIALKDVVEKITENNILEKLQIINHSLQKDFDIEKPRIAVLGLNPHNGEEGIMGKEEQTIIRPAIEKAWEKHKISALGPFSADGFFGAKKYLEFDAILAMYHDQGLIPFKALSFGNGVNFTAGLPIIRTSPDHGTGFDIAGKNIANERSFKAALIATIEIKKSREKHL